MIWNSARDEQTDDGDRAPAARLGEAAGEQDAEDAGDAGGHAAEHRDLGVREVVRRR